MGIFSSVRSFLSSIMPRTSQDTSEPRPTPRNPYLFSSNAVVGGSPGQILEIFRRECEYIGVNLSLENKITKIEFCKAPEAPFHEFMNVYVSWVMPDGKLSDQYRCLITAERFNDNPQGYEDIGAAQARANPGSSTVTSTSAVPASGGSASESTSQSPPVPGDKAATTAPAPAPKPRPSVKEAITRSSRESSRSLEPDAWDMIHIHPALKEGPRAAKNKVTLTFPATSRFNVERLACIMNVVHNAAPGYNVLSTNCYWYARCTWDIIILMCAEEPTAQPENDQAEMDTGVMGYWAYKFKGPMALLPINTIKSPQMVRKDAKGPLLLESESSTNLLEQSKEEVKRWEHAFEESSQVRRRREEHLAQLQAQLAQNGEALAQKDEDLARKDEILAEALADKANAFARIAELEARLVAQSH